MRRQGRSPRGLVKAGMSLRPGSIWYLSTRLHRCGWPRSAKVLKLVNFLLYRSLLPIEADIQPDIHLEHFGLCTVVHPNVTIGYGVKIFHHVTLASESVIGSEHRIFIGNNVTIGAGAIVVGRGNCSLRIGDGAIVGAGSVVTRDVASNDRVVGVPARSIARHPPVGYEKVTQMCEEANDHSR